MARASDWVAAASSFIFLLFLFADAARTPEPSLRALATHGGKPNLVLPLVCSRSNSTRRSVLARRLLGEQVTARASMRLYDDYVTNGYYTTKLFIGTPPQEFALIVDSGSTVTYVPCSTCEQCGNHHQNLRFEPDLSSTYEPVKCNDDCTCDKEQKQCVYESQYTEMSSSSGVLGEDLISFGKESELKPQRAVFGCANSETGNLFNQHADGIIGLGRGELSIMDQLADKGVVTDSFSLCYGGMDVDGGAMVLGEITPPPDMVFSRSDPIRSPYYNIELEEIHVDGKLLHLDPRLFNSKDGTILDSGTTYAYLPEEAFMAFRDAILSNLHSLKRILGPDPNYSDICFSGAGSDVSELSKTFPVVDMVFGNGEKLSLSPENYLFRHSKVSGAYCLGVFQNEKDLTAILGGIIFRNTLVTYDRQNERIGFWKTNCSVLWERLHSDGGPTPGVLDFTNSRVNDSPTPVLPDLFESGVITFDMILNIAYAELLPHAKELEELIAHELQVDINQVNLINIASKGKSTMLRLAIFPAASSGFFSDTTVMDIVSFLSEHRVQLPENFGSYQVVRWNFERPSRSTWWEWRTMLLLVGILLAAFLRFTALSMWPDASRPLDAPLPEEDFCPLARFI
ncbi:aspartic proteinase 36-like [Musa acuminata AAA Group]|uniref:aspartic proteinase 36-like n=1 Tax=Musa acuminata AAA Group TaxID=214697 RepID=UPI0031DA4749